MIFLSLILFTKRRRRNFSRPLFFEFGGDSLLMSFLVLVHLSEFGLGRESKRSFGITIFMWGENFNVVARLKRFKVLNRHSEKNLVN
jgi:hypothetical protein